MRIKYKICGLIGAIALLTACSEETPIGIDNSTESLSITFSTKHVSATKSRTISANDLELRVSSCFIGFFELDTDDSTPGLMIKGINSAVTIVDDTYNYRVDNIILPKDKLSKEVRVLVIANPPAGNSYETYSTYTDFTGEGGKGIVSYENAAEFNPAELIKVGEIDHNFSEDRTAPVDLRQLAAKIHLCFTLEEKKREEITQIESSGQDIVQAINDNKEPTGNPKIEDALVAAFGTSDMIAACTGSGKNPSDHGFYEDYSESTALNHTATNVTNADDPKAKWFVLKCDSARIKKITTWAMEDLEINVNNIALNSPFINPSAFTPNSGGDLNEAIDMESNVLEYTFYTYQKNNIDLNELTVELTGTLVDIVLSSKQMNTGGKVHAVWVDSSNNATAWGSGDHFVQADGNVFGGSGWSDWMDGKPVKGENEIENITYKAIINPKDLPSSTDGILAGNYYDVTATLNVDDVELVEPGVRWFAVSIKKVDDIDIPTFK